MVLSRVQKDVVVDSVREIALVAQSLVVLDYKGIKANDLYQFRFASRSSNLVVKVLKNSLVNRALVKTPFAKLVNNLHGSSLFVFAIDSPADSAKLVNSFLKEFKDVMKVNHVLLSGGDLLGENDLGVIASMPTRQEAISQVVSRLQSIVGGFVNVLREPYAKVARVLSDLSTKI